MAVTIEVDEPEIDIRVRTYDGYVEATGTSAPLAVGDAQIVKGALVDAGPATTALVVGDAQTIEGDGVDADGTSTALVTGDAQTTKGAGVAADGTDVQVAVGSAETSEGESTQADGVEAPLVAGNAQTEHLKPDHRWQMPLPRNLLSDPESFDPGSTAWEATESTYNGTVANVGPNGETADKFTVGSAGSIVTGQSLSQPQSRRWSFGFYARTVSGTNNVKTFVSENNAGNPDSAKITLTTNWRWVSAEGALLGTSGEINKIVFKVTGSGNAGSIYILRAGLNRGSSLEFSTRSEVPQEIPDVVQGADLFNGSTDSPDTNDLSFGVDAEGVPFAVSDGDDRTEYYGDTTTSTWAFRLYRNGVGGYITSHRDRNYFGIWERTGKNGDQLYVFVEEEDGNNNSIGVSGLGGPGWSTVIVTIDLNAGTLRANIDGTVKTLTFDPDNLTPGGWSPIALGSAGQRVSHVEQHPVLTPAEAEAVRQRLAQNPSDPVAPTEAWDFTAETNPHNLISDSESLSTNIARNSLNVDTNVDTDSRGEVTMNRLTEQNDTDGRHRVQTSIGSIPATEPVTFTVEFRPEGREYCYLLLIAPEYADRFVWIYDYNNESFYRKKKDARESDVDSLDFYVQKKNGIHILSAVLNPNTSAIEKAGVGIAKDSTTFRYDGDGTSSIQIGRWRVGRGTEPFHGYAPTNGSIAFPQTAPALRDSSNDLTLGSSSGADTNDGSWVAPIGMAEDGDDQLRAPTKRPTVTWIERIKYTATRAFGRSANGWKVTDTDLVVEDTNGNTASAAHGQTINDGTYHTIAVFIDEVAGVAEVYIDGATTPDATVDLSTVGTLKSSDVELLAEGGTIKQAAYYTRPLSGEEIAYLHERLVDNPQSPHPEYTTP